MAWTTATLFKVERREAQLTIGIEYARDDSLELARETLIVTSVPDVPVLAKAGLDRLNALTTAAAGLTLGPIALPGPPKPPDPPGPPTKEDVDRQTFLVAYGAYLKMQRAVKDGIKKADDADVTAAATAMKAAFKPGYEALLPGAVL